MVSADADGFFGEPAEHFGPVGHFAPCFCQGFAHLRGHDRGEPVGVGYDQFKGASQDVGPLAGCGLAPLDLGTACGLDRARLHLPVRRRPRGR